MEGNIFKILLFTSLLFVAAEMYDGMPMEIKCKNETIKMESFYNNMKTCKEEFKAAKNNSDEHRKRGHTCIMVCALSKDKVFNDKGEYDEAKLNSSIDASLSSSLAEIQKKETALCIRNITLPVADVTDHKCKNYKPLLKCTKKAWMKTCMDEDKYDSEDCDDDDN